MYPCLVLLVFFVKSLCQNKYIQSTNSKSEEVFFHSNGEKQLTNTRYFSNFSDTPKMILGIQWLFWNDFNSKENEINFYIKEANKEFAKIEFSTTSESSSSFQGAQLKYLAFVNNEAQIFKIILVEEDIKNMVKNGSSFLRSSTKKKANTKRSVSCFIIAFRQEFSTIPTAQTDYVLSFFVDTSRELNENQFELKFTTLDQSNNLKWIKLDCIEFYDYEKNFEPFEFIQIIHENQYDYSQIQTLDQYFPEKQFIQNIKSQVLDISFKFSEIFIGFNGIDQKVQYNRLCIDYYDEQKLYYDSNKLVRALSSSFIIFKMKNCPSNCEDCSDSKTCLECKLKFTLDKNAQCIPCKDKCLSCDINLNCLACEQPYFLYKTQCYISQPKRTYCVQRPFDQL